MRVQYNYNINSTTSTCRASRRVNHAAPQGPFGPGSSRFASLRLILPAKGPGQGLTRHMHCHALPSAALYTLTRVTMIPTVNANPDDDRTNW